MSWAAPNVMAPKSWRARNTLEPSSYHRLWYSSRPTRRAKASSSTPTGAARLSMIPDVVQDPVEEGLRRHRLQLLARAQPHAHCARLLVAAARHYHVGHLLRLCFGDLALHLFVAVVKLRADPEIKQPVVEVPKIRHVLIGDRNQRRLHRGQPHRERAGVFLDEIGDHAHQRADDAAVDHDRPMEPGVLADVLELELVRQVEVHLDGRD